MSPHDKSGFHFPPEKNGNAKVSKRVTRWTLSSPTLAKQASGDPDLMVQPAADVNGQHVAIARPGFPLAPCGRVGNDIDCALAK
jgi:hypothetical protein